MGKLSITLLAGVTMIASAFAASAQPVKVGIAAEPYPPFTLPDASGKWQGWEIDFINAMCSEAKLECVITPLAWDGIIPALNSNKIDMIIASLSITAERLKVIDFSDKYYQTPSMIIGLKDMTFDATPEGLAGKTLGVQASTIHQVYAMKHFAPAGATVREYQTQDEANNDLDAGRIDAVQADTFSSKVFLETDIGRSCCNEKGNVKQDEAVLGPGIGVGLRKSDTELKNKVNAAIKAIRVNGTYDAITKKYFSYDIYGD